MVSGILSSHSVQLPEISSGVNKQVKLESKVKQFKRFLMNKYTDYDGSYLPFIQPLLEQLSQTGELVFAIDGSTSGRECMVLMISIIYKKRAIPILWLAKKGKKGHLSEALHCQLVENLMMIVPEHCRKVLLGDGEFDGTSLQELLRVNDWNYVLRTRKDMIAEENTDCFCLKFVGTGQQEYFFIPNVLITHQRYGPVNLLIWHSRKYKDALYLLTNLDFAQQISSYYKKRFTIETFFSDQKTKGFQLHRSKIEDPERLACLLIAACLAYIFIILVALQAQQQNLLHQIHRKDRCDWSLFTIGKRAMEYLVDQRIWYGLSYELLNQKTVR